MPGCIQRTYITLHSLITLPNLLIYCQLIMASGVFTGNTAFGFLGGCSFLLYIIHIPAFASMLFGVLALELDKSTYTYTVQVG